MDITTSGVDVETTTWGKRLCLETRQYRFLSGYGKYTIFIAILKIMNGNILK